MGRVLREVPLNVELVNYIRKLEFEASGYKGIMNTIKTNRSQYSDEIYDYYDYKCNEAVAAYNIANQELANMFGEGLNPQKVIISVDFNNQELQIMEAH